MVGDGKREEKAGGCPKGGGYEGRSVTGGPVSGGGVLGDVMGTWGSLQ